MGLHDSGLIPAAFQTTQVKLSQKACLTVSNYNFSEAHIIVLCWRRPTWVVKLWPTPSHQAAAHTGSSKLWPTLGRQSPAYTRLSSSGPHRVIKLRPIPGRQPPAHTGSASSGPHRVVNLRPTQGRQAQVHTGRGS